MVLADKDVNAPVEQQQQQQQQQGQQQQDQKQTEQQDGTKDVKSMEYHRQVFQSKIAAEPTKQYVSPSDNIMSPCSAKISALRNKHASKAKPRSLFAQAKSKKIDGENALGARPIP